MLFDYSLWILSLPRHFSKEQWNRAERLLEQVECLDCQDVLLLSQHEDDRVIALQYDLIVAQLVSVLERLGFSLLELACKEEVQEDTLVLVEELAVKDDLITYSHEWITSAYLAATPEDCGYGDLLLELAYAGHDCECLEVDAGEVGNARVRQTPNWWLGHCFNSSVDFGTETELIKIRKHSLSKDCIR